MDPAKRRYRLYLDESGDHTYCNLGDTNSRFLALLGLWFEQGTLYPAFEKRLVAFKQEIFGDGGEKIVFHRKEILNRKGPFEVLKDPDLAARFDAGWLKLIADARYRCICVVIDKQAHAQKYTRPYHPYHYALAAVLDRYCGWLRKVGAEGDILAESRNKQDNLALEAAYRRILTHGTIPWKDGLHSGVLTSKQIKFRKKHANTSGLQLCDSIAFPLRQWAIVGKGHAERRENTYGTMVVRACAPRLNRKGKTGRIKGYGFVWLPACLPDVQWPVE